MAGPHLDHVPEKGAINGLATLDGTAQLPKAQLTPGTLVLDDDASSDGLSSITGTTAFQTKLSFSPGNGPYTGRFRLGWSSEFSHDTGGGDTEVQLRRTDGGSVVLAFNEEEAEDGDDWNTFAGFIYLNLTAVSPTFVVEFRTVQAGNTASIRRVRLEWIEVIA